MGRGGANLRVPAVGQVRLGGPVRGARAARRRFWAAAMLAKASSSAESRQRRGRQGAGQGRGLCSNLVSASRRCPGAESRQNRAAARPARRPPPTDMPSLRPSRAVRGASFRASLPALVAPELRADDGRELECGSTTSSPARGFGRAWAGRGCVLRDVETGIEIGALSADVPENPASNAKLVTAGAALSKLGGNFVFTSGLYGSIVDGRVANLVLRSDGDPSLTSADLTLLASGLRQRGVREVGDVWVDQSAFDEQYVPPAFEQQPEEWAAFRAPVSAVAVDRNSVTGRLRRRRGAARRA